MSFAKESKENIMSLVTADTIHQLIDENKLDILTLWKDLVHIPTHTGSDREKFIMSCDFLINHTLKDIPGLKIDYTHKNCALLTISSLRDMNDVDTKPILFMGHLDTVLSVTSSNVEERDGNLYGPGALDMKGGLVILFYALRFLNELDRLKCPIKVVITFDEETGHVNHPDTERILAEFCTGCRFGFSFETAGLNGHLAIARKGTASCDITIHGKAAHPGMDYNKGVSAIREAARQIRALEKLSTMDHTISVGTIHGGTARNAIPNKVNMQLDVRYAHVDALAKIKSSIEDVCYRNRTAGTTTDITFIPGIPPMRLSEYSQKLYQHVQDTSIACGLEPVRHWHVIGGGGDAAYATMVGVPMVDQMGVRGENNHTDNEYAVIDSIYDKLKLVVASVISAKSALS